jgi:hypothetical protein
MEQLGDASKHEHRYVVYRHKATVESSGSEENGMIWYGTGPFSDAPWCFVATLYDTMDQLLKALHAASRGKLWLLGAAGTATAELVLAFPAARLASANFIEDPAFCWSWVKLEDAGI